MVLLEAMSQGETAELDAVFEFLCTSVVRQNYMATKHSSMINQFILAINTCRTAAAANPLTAEDRAIFWHNWRTTEKPEGIAQLTNINYYAIRLEAVCNVIKKVLNLIFKPEEIRRAVEECDFAFFGRARFFNVEGLGYSIYVSHFDQETNSQTNVPLPEGQLTVAHTKLERCVYFRQIPFDKIVDNVNNVMADAADYTKIMIKSANPEAGTYNFYNAITMRSEVAWYGWRAAGSTNFGKFCGVQNEILDVRDWAQVEMIPGIEEMCLQAGYSGVGDVFRPSNILPHYGYTEPPDEAKLPPPLRMNPYVFRNGEGDYPMPDDACTKHYLTGDYSPASTPKRRRDDVLRSGGGAAQTNQSVLGSNPGEGVTSNTPLSSMDRDSDDPGENLEDDDEEEVSKFS